MPTRSPHDATDLAAPPRRGRWRTLAAGAALAVAATLLSAGVASADPACDDDPGWAVAGASVDGAPNGFAAGDTGRTYLWHDHGWHLRTTDSNPAPHLYTGTVVAAPGTSFVDVRKVHVDPADRLWVDQRHVLHYAFVTHDHIDGIDFRVAGCTDAGHRRLVFALRKNGAADPALIDLGAHRSHPETVPFTATRG